MLFRPMQPQDVDTVLAMSQIFYASDALSHPVPLDIIHRNIQSALSDDTMLRGFVMVAEASDSNSDTGFNITPGTVVGFSYLTHYYETEVGGVCVQIVDLYVDPKYRGRGIATAYLNFVFDSHPTARRFRLEVTKDNHTARELYDNVGFHQLDYDQMSIDHI